jgi:hypothetical protein
VRKNSFLNADRPDWETRELKEARRYQDEGYLVLTSRSNRYPLPYLYDLPNLEHDPQRTYQTPWGVVRHEGVGSYLLSLEDIANGPELPPEVVKWVGKTLQLAVVTVAAARRQATVRVEEDSTEVLLTDVPTWDSPWSLLPAVNKTLREQGLPIVCNHLDWAMGEEENTGYQLWSPGTPVPMARNDHTAVHLTGYAHDDNLAVQTTRLPAYHSPLWTPLPDQAAHHLALLGRAATEPYVEDGVGITYLLVWDGDDEPQATAKRLLVERLNAALPIPILPEWADALWQAADSRR